MVETHAAVLVRMPIAQKEQLQKSAQVNARTLTGEINARLKTSLAAQGPTLQGILSREAFGTTPYPTGSAQVHHTNNVNPAPNDNGPAAAITDIDRAMLDVFHTLPPEKQLALLSLFR